MAKNKPVRAENVFIVPGWTSYVLIILASGVSPVINRSEILALLIGAKLRRAVPSASLRLLHHAVHVSASC